MARIHVTRDDGEEFDVDAPAGKSLMIALRDNADGHVSDEQFGLCGGCCTCYTCHVWVDEEFLGRLAPPSAQENDLLDLAEHRQGNSRLACQIPVNADIDGIRVTLPPVA